MGESGRGRIEKAAKAPEVATRGVGDIAGAETLTAFGITVCRIDPQFLYFILGVSKKNNKNKKRGRKRKRGKGSKIRPTR